MCSLAGTLKYRPRRVAELRCTEAVPNPPPPLICRNAPRTAPNSELKPTHPRDRNGGPETYFHSTNPRQGSDGPRRSVVFDFAPAAWIGILGWRFFAKFLYNRCSDFAMVCLSWSCRDGVVAATVGCSRCRFVPNLETLLGTRTNVRKMVRAMLGRPAVNAHR